MLEIERIISHSMDEVIQKFYLIALPLKSGRRWYYCTYIIILCIYYYVFVFIFIFIDETKTNRGNKNGIEKTSQNEKKNEKTYVHCLKSLVSFAYTFTIDYFHLFNAVCKRCIQMFTNFNGEQKKNRERWRNVHLK